MKRLEQQINMSVRRFWFPKPILQHLEGRRKQCEKFQEQGMILSVQYSIAALKDILKKNGYKFIDFVNDVFNVLYN